ncbi:DUF4232 domain-containing protein [Streptomyces sp. MB09-02B]|uniref:DUF4232 domain-containing protein n=1 Tax=Streptomyces sp. MB09-02B TaxID=3028667 RepID=UPI0029A388BE|nr:DUF4232 domain-containing protein [Streptomyces sp. MB09-02B]MDX3642872.1 DUF4232 domain-containing protein [Streptomyces sp. MB09-02B]
MIHTVRSRRITAVLAACSLGIVALTACGGDTDKGKASPRTSASPSRAASDDAVDASATAQPGGEGGEGGASSDSDGSTPPSKSGSGKTGTGKTGAGKSGSGTSGSEGSGTDDDQDGGVGMCETTDLNYDVTVASKEANHALLTATNNSGDPCLLSANDLVITIPELDGAAEHRGPTVDDWLLNPGDRAYAGILFAGPGTEGGKTADQVEIALTAAESPATVTIADGPVTVNDGAVTSFLGTAEDALSY